jgi:hypothetical protein
MCNTGLSLHRFLKSTETALAKPVLVKKRAKRSEVALYNKQLRA